MAYAYPIIRMGSYHGVIGLYERFPHQTWLDMEDQYQACINAKLSLLNTQDLQGWRILLEAVYHYRDQIGVLKRSRRYPTDQEVAASLCIPIPDLEQAAYGFNGTHKNYFHGKSPDRILTDPKSFYILETDFSKYTNLQDYIVDSVLRAIDVCFTHGITVNGKKIKYFQDR